MSHITEQYIQDLRQIFHSDLSSDEWYTILTCAFTSAGFAMEAIPLIYKEAIRLHAPRFNSKYDQEAIKIQKRIKEALLKTTLVYGVPRMFGGILNWIPDLRKEAEQEPNRNDAGTTIGTKKNELTIDQLNQPAHKCLRVVYKHNLDEILVRFGDDVNDLLKIFINFWYGWALEFIEILNFQSTELCMTSALTLQKLKLETLWHMRGALRAGVSVPALESVRQVCLKIANDAGISLNKIPKLDEISEDSNQL